MNAHQERAYADGPNVGITLLGGRAGRVCSAAVPSGEESADHPLQSQRTREYESSVRLRASSGSRQGRKDRDAVTRCNCTSARVVETAVRIRVFETKLLELFQGGSLSGTVHTCIGQEFCAAALHPHLRKGVDAFFATHRGHGHYLAYGGPEDALLAELMGRAGALCLGRGGTQNLCFRRFFSAGIQGGSAPIATGYAWAMKRRREGAIAVAQIGDGTLGEGTLYEAFTFAALLGAPVLFLLEYNGWAQSTDVRTTTPGDVLQRASGFGLEVDWIKDDDPDQLYEHLGRVVSKVRRGHSLPPNHRNAQIDGPQQGG